MRILVALIAVFMVSGAMAQKKPTTPSYDCLQAGTCSFSCQFKNKGPSGPIYACKDPKTGKVVNVECKVPPNKAQMMPRELPATELPDVCSLRSDNRF